MARRRKNSADWRNSLLGIGFLGTLYIGFNEWDDTHIVLFTIVYGMLPLVISIILMVAIDSLLPQKNKTPSKNKSIKTGIEEKKVNLKTNENVPNQCRPDAIIVKTPLRKLTWQEFERLFALYFRDQGYEVEETGIGGKDGGVDLILIDKKTHERTAVQLKHWSDKHPVGPNIVRELDSARKNTNPPCLYSWLIASSDITPQARLEAEKRYMTVWHGGMVLHKLSQWKYRESGNH